MNRCETAESSSQAATRAIDGKQSSPLDEVLREGARAMLVEAVEAEVAAYTETHRHEVDEANKHKAMSYVRMKQLDKMILAGVKKLRSRPRRWMRERTPAMAESAAR